MTDHTHPPAPDPRCCLDQTVEDCSNTPSRLCDGLRPDPRDAVIAQLVEAGTRLSHKHQPSENDNLLARQMKLVALAKWNAAIAAAKAVRNE